MTRIEAVRGDITEQRVDSIVNAASTSLLGGGGVDGAIHRAGGPRILAACRELRRTSLREGLPTGCAVATTAGDLPSRLVIHTVGPKHWDHADGGADLLADCHRNSLDVAEAMGCTSIAFPAISCGVYGWTADNAAPIAIAAVRLWLVEHPSSTIEVIRFVLFNDHAAAAFTAGLAVE